ncbi:MAG: nitroreductase/quinone reductase family protein [Chloroflexota bacterium]
MDDRVRRALSRGHLIDITTTGRRSGQPRRVELVFHNIGGRIYISGRPGRRGWLANLVANPRFTFHLKGPIRADLPATARPITDPAERRAVLAGVARAWNMDVGLLLRGAPLVEVEIEPDGATEG